jgi:hypothetical protein
MSKIETGADAFIVRTGADAAVLNRLPRTRLTSSLADVERVFTKWYQLTDTLSLHITLAAVAANLAEGDPFWLLLVAPPGSMKTEIIRALGGCPWAYPLSSLTAQTFASGYQTKGDEPSLLMRLDRKILTLKDFTSVLTMHRDARQIVLGQLREVYDGAYKKGSATGRSWTGAAKSDSSRASPPSSTPSHPSTRPSARDSCSGG